MSQWPDCWLCGIVTAASSSRLPLQLELYRDRGEFWDAWDLAADYRSHPLGVVCRG